jgi:hypothetical protein
MNFFELFCRVIFVYTFFDESLTEILQLTFLQKKYFVRNNDKIQKSTPGQGPQQQQQDGSGRRLRLRISILSEPDQTPRSSVMILKIFSLKNWQTIWRFGL